MCDRCMLKFSTAYCYHMNKISEKTHVLVWQLKLLDASQIVPIVRYKLNFNFLKCIAYYNKLPPQLCCRALPAKNLAKHEPNEPVIPARAQKKNDSSSITENWLVIFGAFASAMIVLLLSHYYSQQTNNQYTQDVQNQNVRSEFDTIHLETMIKVLRGLMDEVEQEKIEQQFRQAVKTYSENELNTLRRLRLIDLYGNECVEPLDRHEKVCRNIYEYSVVSIIPLD